MRARLPIALRRGCAAPCWRVPGRRRRKRSRSEREDRALAWLRADNPGLDLVNPDGSGRTTLRTPGGYAPVWSADGRWLAYSTFPEPWVLRVVRADGTGDREVLLLAPERLRRGRRSTRGPDRVRDRVQVPAGLCAVRVADGKTA